MGDDADDDDDKESSSSSSSSTSVNNNGRGYPGEEEEEEEEEGATMFENNRTKQKNDNENDNKNKSKNDNNNNRKKENSDDDGAIAVKFAAKKSLSTPPLPLPPPPLLDDDEEETLDDFFANNEYCNLLFASGAVVEEIQTPFKELEESFKKFRLRSSTHSQSNIPETESGGARSEEEPPPPAAAFPEASDDVSTTRVEEASKTRFVRLTNPPLSFIGVKLNSVSTVGIQFFRARTNAKRQQQQQQQQVSEEKNNGPKVEEATALPELHFTLLTTTFVANGPWPLVWLFYKIIGVEKEEEKEGDNKDGHRVIGVENDEGNSGLSSSSSSRFQTFGSVRVWAGRRGENEIVFTNLAWLESQILVPPILIKILPISLEQMEKQGSDTLRDAIERDIGPAMERYKSAYMEWLAKKNDSSESDKDKLITK